MRTPRIICTPAVITPPQFHKWRKTPGSVAVRYPGFLRSDPCRYSYFNTLKDARKTAASLVSEGKEWAEVFRMAENGVSLQAVAITTYSRETAA